LKRKATDMSHIWYPGRMFPVSHRSLVEVNLLFKPPTLV